MCIRDSRYPVHAAGRKQTDMPAPAERQIRRRQWPQSEGRTAFSSFSRCKRRGAAFPQAEIMLNRLYDAFRGLAVAIWVDRMRHCSISPVSYTHLDVYKRQRFLRQHKRRRRADFECKQRVQFGICHTADTVRPKISTQYQTPNFLIDNSAVTAFAARPPVPYSCAGKPASLHTARAACG